ncbi:hypothetical protein [Acidithrix sp. C25]|uniref:hypothetical protein n=1 Tax=Acidithrix sp. C25 TaxID=1671482 RepID=UPI00191B92C1|nr:hypothetical protein [Acidithrix sp. C25]
MTNGLRQKGLVAGTIVLVILLLGFTFVTYNGFGTSTDTQINPVQIEAQPKANFPEKIKTTATTHRTNILKYRTSGSVSVGLPNFSGDLSVVFKGTFAEDPNSKFRLAVDGVPTPFGTLTLRTSNVMVQTAKNYILRGNVTQFSSRFVRMQLTSANGLKYIAVLHDFVNGIANTFTGIFFLAPRG